MEQQERLLRKSLFLNAAFAFLIALVCVARIFRHNTQVIHMNAGVRILDGAFGFACLAFCIATVYGVMKKTYKLP